MDPNALGGSSSGSVASRFVSETQLSAAQKKREDDIRAAYARMGQTPPPEAFQKAEDEAYDPRTLYEKLKAQSDAKQEAFEEKTKLANQFRGIDDAESEFLAEVAKEKAEEQRKRDEETRKELDEFRKAAIAREASPPGPLGATPTTAKPVPKTDANAHKKAKRKRESVFGIVKKKTAKSDEALGDKLKVADKKVASKDIENAKGKE